MMVVDMVVAVIILAAGYQTFHLEQVTWRAAPGAPPSPLVFFSAPFWAVLGVFDLVVGNTAQAFACAAASGLLGWVIWRWWSGRRPRRRATRVAGRIRDLGHRLIVAPA